jgi:hypothetical protein
LRAEAKRSIECFPNLVSSFANNTGSSRQSSLSRCRLSLSAETLAAYLMQWA